MTFNLSLDKLFGNLRKLGPIILAIGIVSGLILFLPESAIKKLHLEAIPENWFAPIGIIFLVSVFLIIIIVSQLIISGITKRLSYTINLRALKKSFNTLSPIQKHIIRELLLSDEKYVILEITDGNASFLTEKGYIWRPAQPVILGRHDRNSIRTKFLAQPWLLSAYNKDPDYFLRD